MKEYSEKEHLGKWRSWLTLAGIIYTIVLILTEVIVHALSLSISQEAIIATSFILTIALLIAVKYTSKSKEAKHYKEQAKDFEEELKRIKNGKKKRR